HGHDFLAEVASAHGHAGHHGDQISKHRNGGNNVQIVQVAEVAGALFALGGRIVFGHVLHEDVARWHAFDEQRADVADHGRQPVFLLEGVGGGDGNCLLSQTGVEPADNFVLAEELGHGVFDGAGQPHVVIQVEVLLPSEFLVHSVSRTKTFYGPRYAETATGAVASASASFSSKNSRSAGFISRLNTSPQYFINRGATSWYSTRRPSNFSSDVARQSAMPQGTIRSK